MNNGIVKHEPAKLANNGTVNHKAAKLINNGMIKHEPVKFVTYQPKDWQPEATQADAATLQIEQKMAADVEKGVLHLALVDGK